MKQLIYRMWQCTWGCLQTLMGLMLYIRTKGCKRFEYKGAIGTVWNHRGGISLGMFIFVSKADDARMIAHEYGHTLQSLLLGPLYLLVIGAPSYIWCNVPYFRRKRKECNIDYHSLYTEKWANSWGKANTKESK